MNHNRQKQWREIPLKFLFIDRAIGAWGQEPTSENEGIVCIRAADFLTHQLRHTTQNLTRRVYEPQEIVSRILQKGDLIIEKSGGGETQPVGRVISFGLEEPAMCSNFLERLRPNQKRLDSRFGAYLFYWLWSTNRNYPFIKQTTGIQNLDAEDYLSSFVRVPLVVEQRAIADYLDGETAKLDALISAKQRLLEVLAEKRRALITHAVTRGLNPDAPMKDSGVEWIGQIPVRWEVVSFVRFLKSIVDYRGRTPTKADSGVFLVTARNIRDGKIDYEISKEYIEENVYESTMSRGAIEIGDLLFTTEAPLGQVALIDRDDVALAQRVIKIRYDSKILLNEFVMYWMMSTVFQWHIYSLSTGSTVLGIKAEKLPELCNIIPPMKEQISIVSYLRQAEAKLKSLFNITQLTLQSLQERRTALIATTVTGENLITT